MSDLIRRSDAIDELMHIIPYKRYHNGEYVFLIDKRKCLKAIKDVPVANKPQGEWITEHNGNGWNDYWDYTCTNCKMKFPRADNILYKSNFCPNCGARMKGADDEP